MKQASVKYMFLIVGIINLRDVFNCYLIMNSSPNNIIWPLLPSIAYCLYPEQIQGLHIFLFIVKCKKLTL